MKHLLDVKTISLAPPPPKKKIDCKPRKMRIFLGPQNNGHTNLLSTETKRVVSEKATKQLYPLKFHKRVSVL